jgi:hypothetical protein
MCLDLIASPAVAERDSIVTGGFQKRFDVASVWLRTAFP